jgi:hypothetical protein
MRRDTDDAGVVFKCTCGVVDRGTPADGVLVEKTMGGTLAMQSVLIRNSPYDRAGNKVERECSCGLPYMTQVLVGEDMVPVWTCDCQT